MSATLEHPIGAMFAEMRPRAVRTLREFAEQEIVLPSGPRRDLRFEVAFMPWTGLVLDEIESGRWRRIFGTGSVQSGKTLLFLQAPTLYHLFEVEEDVIMGAPKLELGYSIFRQRILPVMRRTRYRDLLPAAGPGSKGGKTEAIEFRNGATLRFMGAGGDDAQRASYTARVVVMTELDKMDVPGEVSREADPVRQMEARTSAFGSEARIYGECTISTKEGRIYQETDVLGSGSRVLIRCRHCREWIYPERNGLVGWRDAPNQAMAGRQAGYACPKCGAVWDEADRQAALQRPVLLHRGQTIDRRGHVAGEVPDTATFGVKWNAMHSPLVPMATIAEDEWRADRLATQSEERALCQFTWTLPWEEKELAKQVSYGLLARHAGEYPFDPLGAISSRPAGPLPEGVEFTIGTVDVQKAQLYFAVDGYAVDGLTRWTLAYGVEEIVPEGATSDPTERDICRALDAVLDVLDRYQCDSVWVDSGYRYEGTLGHTVREWCRVQREHVHPIVGRAHGQMERMTGKRMDLPPDVPDLIQARYQDDGGHLFFLDVDRLKDEVHFRLFREEGMPGYHWFPRDAANDARTDRARGAGSQGWIFSHYMRAKREIRINKVSGREERVWRETGRYDLWDCSAYSLAGAMLTAAEIREERELAAARREPVRGAGGGASSIRTRY